MTNELFIGGLMILTLVAGIVIAMTSKHSSGERGYDHDSGHQKDGKTKKETSRR